MSLTPGKKSKRLFPDQGFTIIVARTGKRQWQPFLCAEGGIRVATYEDTGGPQRSEDMAKTNAAHFKCNLLITTGADVPIFEEDWR